MVHPKTDEEWENLAECIVTRHRGVSPESVGELTVCATQTIFSWYKGEERRKALSERQYARDRLMGLAREAGCTPGEEAHYWEVTNMVTGEILQSGKKQESIAGAVRDAKKTLHRSYQEYGDNHLIIKVFGKSPDEREGLTYEPEYSESFWVKSEVEEKTLTGEIEEAYERAKRTGEVTVSPFSTGRPFPETYGDWVSLAMGIKEKAGIDDLETTRLVNEHLNHIYEEEQDPEVAQGSKRWLAGKARELGVG